MGQVRTISELVVRPVERDEELRLANELMAKVQEHSYFSSFRWLETSGAGYPGFRREHTRIALWKDEVAGALRIGTDTIRIGEARLKMGGVGWITTAPRHRCKGVCTALMADAFAYLARHDYHVSMLFGIPNFYHRFGYAAALADYAIVMDAFDDSSGALDGCRVRGVKPGDIASIQKIHASNDAEVPCSLLRGVAHFTNKWDRFKAARVFTDPQGKVLAYVLTHGESGCLAVEEVGAVSPDLYRALVAQCSAMAREKFVSRIRFLVPPSHPFAHFLLQYDSTHETKVSRENGGMMALVDVGEALENMIPEWESLLIRGVWRTKRCEVTLVVDNRPYRLRANRGAIDVAQMAGRNKFALERGELMQLMAGYRYLDDILQSKRRLLTAEARELLAGLFPKRSPCVWPFDRF